MKISIPSFAQKFATLNFAYKIFICERIGVVEVSFCGEFDSLADGIVKLSESRKGRPAGAENRLFKKCFNRLLLRRRLFDRLLGGVIRKGSSRATLGHKIYLPVTNARAVSFEKPISQKPQLWGVS